MIESLPIDVPIQGDLSVPGDKSISHRALILAAIASGETRIQHCLSADDCLSTANILKHMGVCIEWQHEYTMVQGVGLHGLLAPKGPLDCGNSGTTMRLLAGLLAGQAFDSRLIGDESLSMRPMMRIVAPLRLMGAQIEATSGHAPLDIRGGNQLKAIQYQLPVPSAQVKSCILLAGLYAHGVTRVSEPIPTRDHTERLLPILKEHGKQIRLLQVPGDLSSAAFFIVLATIVKGSVLMLRRVGVNSSRMGVIEILREMGADITIHDGYDAGREPVADIEVRYAPLRGVSVSNTLLTRAIDEFPILLVAAACAEGVSCFHGIQELRYKECDRAQVMVQGLNRLGIVTQIEGDSVIIRGGTLTGGEINAHHDHRVAMAFACAGAISKTGIWVANAERISTSFPTFITLANQIGCDITIQQRE